MTAPRDLPPLVATDIAAEVLRPFLAVRIATPDPVHAFTGKGTMTIDGNDYLGIEGVATISPVEEGTDGSATGMRCVLQRIPSEFSSDLSDNAKRGALFEAFVGTMDDAYQNIRGWKKIWKGTLQGFDIIDGGSELTAVVTGESRQIDQRRPAIKRFTDEYQQRKYPGDVVFEYVAKMAEIPILWAQAGQDGV